MKTLRKFAVTVVATIALAGVAGSPAIAGTPAQPTSGNFGALETETVSGDFGSPIATDPIPVTKAPTANKILAPFGRCNEFHWQRKSSTVVRIYAFSDDLKTLIPKSDPYALLNVNIHDANGNLKHSGSYNASWYSQFDRDFTARAGWTISLSLVDADDQYPTYCTGAATV